MEDTNDLVQFKKFLEDVCDCDEKCPKCGKRKRQEARPYQPVYPQPWYPQPQWPGPWINWTSTKVDL